MTTRVMIGGQTVNLRVQTVEVSGLQAQAAAEAALVTIAANVAAAQAAEADAEAAAVSAAEDAAQTTLDRAATAADRETVDDMVDQAAAYVSAIPPDVTYATEAAGRAAVADGEMFWLRTVNGLALYVRNSAVSSSAVTVSSIPVLQPSVRYLGQNLTVVRLEFVSGTISSNYVMKVANPNVLLAGSGTGYIFEYPSPFNCNGNHNIEIRQNDGVTAFLGLTQVQAPDGGTPALGSFKKYDWMRIVRVPSPVGDYPGDTNELLQLAAPSTAVTDLSKGVQTWALQYPSANFPVSIQRIDEKNYVVKVAAVRYDSAGYALDSDHIVYVMKDLADSMSGGNTTCASALALNTDYLVRNGQEFRYSQFISNELPGGNWTREQPSTTEPVDRVGTYGDLVSTYHLQGLNHGGAIGNIAADKVMTMDGVPIDLEIEEIKDGDELIIEQRFDLYRTITPSPVQCGERIFRHTFNADVGCRIYAKANAGRSLSFDAGLIEIEPGDTITGGTSGAVGIVQSIPARQQTGAWGSTKAGTLHIKQVSGTWQNNEAIQVGGVTHATVDGTLGIQVGIANAYGVLMCNTTVNRIKMNGYPVAFDLGAADVSQRPSTAEMAAGQWAVPGDTFGAYHTVNMNTDGVGPIRELYIPSGGPMTPPGDYSLCVTTKAFVEDRAGGNRKVVINWCSSSAGPSATDAQLFEGEFITEYDIYYRWGQPA